MSRGWKNFEVRDRKCIDYLEGKLAVEKVSIVLENTYNMYSTNRMLLEIWRLKMLLEGSQIKMRDMLLKNEGKIMLVKKWQRPWQNCVLLFSGGK